MARAHAAIVADVYPSFLKNFFQELHDGDMGKVPLWAVRALRGVGVELMR